MTHKKCSPGLIHICLLSAVALTLAVPASAELEGEGALQLPGRIEPTAPSLPVGGVVFRLPRQPVRRDYGRRPCDVQAD